MLSALLLITAAYLIGSLSSAIIVCKLWGLPDPRSKGSNNPGTTNVLRIGGKLPALITLFGDGLKGFLPTIVAIKMDMEPWIVGCVMLFALLGHVAPIFFNFKGGKGVATAMGTSLALNWQFGLCLICIWILVFAISRISSLAAIVATLLSPLVAWWFFNDQFLTAAISLMGVLLLLRHKDNIVRLLHGKEAKI